jgi:hypothetical protein
MQQSRKEEWAGPRKMKYLRWALTPSDESVFLWTSLAWTRGLNAGFAISGGSEFVFCYFWWIGPFAVMEHW